MNDDSVLVARWQPWPEVTVISALQGQAPWHVRAHCVTADRPLEVLEYGFSVGWQGGDPGEEITREAGAGRASVRTAAGITELADVAFPDGLGEAEPRGVERSPATVELAPNTSLVAARALTVQLSAALAPGTHLVATMVWASPDPYHDRPPDDVWADALARCVRAVTAGD